MNGVMAMTDLALETDLTAEQRDYLETAKSSADALLRIINDILDFSKIEAGKLDLESIDFDLRKIIEEALSLMRPSAEQKGLKLISEMSPDIPHFVQGDPIRMRQIILNLVGNAVKFTESGSVVVCAGLEPANDEAKNGDEIRLHFEVQDTGIGIPIEKQKLIFEAIFAS
jgi:two-component system, sensor histidine kinase and response regulator